MKERLKFKKHYKNFVDNMEDIVNKGVDEFGEEQTIRGYLEYYEAGSNRDIHLIHDKNGIVGCIMRYNYNNGLTLYFNSHKNMMYFDYKGETKKVYNYCINNNVLNLFNYELKEFYGEVA